MRITILTPSYNQAQFIEENILSVLNQSHPDVEHIVIDGGSTDKTTDILKKYPSVRWVSEKDEGQADALQKGLEMATGDIIGWINSDDYLEEGALEFVNQLFSLSETQWIIGNVSVLESNNETREMKSAKITKTALLSDPDCLRQQATFFRKQALLDVGGFDKEYHLTMDLELWFRLLEKSEPTMIDKNLAYFRMHKDQKTSGKHVSNQLKEMLRIFKKNGASYPCLIKLIWNKSKLLFLTRSGTLKRRMLNKE